ncbi:MAG: hypothetical protein LQ352_008384, partial [Teloschistes flavicans]
MRSIFILVALAACTTAIPLLSSPTNDDASSPLLSNKETGLTTRGDTSVGMYDHELHQRWLTLFLLAVSTWNTIPSGVALFFGMYSLGRSVYSIYDDCHQPQGTKDKVDCLLSCLDLVFAAFMGGWKLRSGITRDINSLHTHAVYNSSAGPTLNVHAHIAPIDESLAKASIQTANNGTWARHATVYSGDLATHHLMYRQAHHTDLGFDNDGSFHQYRLQPTEDMLTQLRQSKNTTDHGKREEDNSYGLVADYLWKN